MNRRVFLRGASRAVAVMVGLPVLECMLDGHGEALANGQPLPKRFVVWFWGNGNEPDRWAPAATGSTWEPTFALQALAAHQPYVSLVTGTRLPTRGTNNPHVEGVVGILTGGNPLLHSSYAGSSDWNYMTAPVPSVDQLVAAHYANATRFRSIDVGVTQPHGSSGPGKAVSYISHSAPYTPNVPLLSPLEVYQRLFTEPLPNAEPAPVDPMIALRTSVLDAVKQDAAALNRRLGKSDQRRLESHLEGIRALEQRLTLIQPETVSSACKQPAQPENPTSTAARSALMSELVSMAFACDLTRVATVQYSSPASHSRFDSYGSELACGGTPKSFHEYEHCAGFNDTVRGVLKSFVDNYAQFIGALKATPEGTGNLLDHSCVLGTSELGSGWEHGHSNFPLIIAGKAGGALRSGLHISAPGDLSTRVPFTLLKAMGLPLTSWGQEQFTVNTPVPGLLV